MSDPLYNIWKHVAELELEHATLLLQFIKVIFPISDLLLTVLRWEAFDIT